MCEGLPEGGATGGITGEGRKERHKGERRARCSVEHRHSEWVLERFSGKNAHGPRGCMASDW